MAIYDYPAGGFAVNTKPLRADTLEQALLALSPEPLASDDPRYVDLAKGRGSKPLDRLRIILQAAARDEEQFAKIVFTGHRGCGKTTELLRLEGQLTDQFTCVHLFVEQSLLNNYDYTLLFLWLVDELATYFENQLNRPLSKHAVGEVARWFATVLSQEDRRVLKEIGLETEAAGGTDHNWFGLRVKLMAYLKSMIRGSEESRRTITRTLQKYSSDLLEKVNLLLDEAHRTLAGQGDCPSRLLLVIDNLDRLPRRISEPLFFDNGDMLKSLRVRTIYTVPVAIAVAPRNIYTVFPAGYTLPMLKVQTSQNKGFRRGLESLRAIALRRLDEKLFQTSKPINYLCRKSGGSIRDLMRLLYNAAVSALARGNSRIGMPDAEDAVQQMRVDFERLFLDYLALARIHVHKTVLPSYRGVDHNEMEPNVRDTLRAFLENGAVFEYNGDGLWYDVHPVIQDIEEFRKAVAHVTTDGN